MNKNIKSLLAIVLSIAMCLSFTSLSFAYIEDRNEFSCGAGPYWATVTAGEVTLTSDGLDGVDDCTEVYVPDTVCGYSVTTIGNSVYAEFRDTKKLYIPNGIKNIGSSTFENCVSLEEITIPASIERIGGKAFLNCGALTDVCYGGTEEQWKKISIGSGNDFLLDAKIHYNYCKHEYTSVITSQASCIKNGVKTYTCKHCSATYTEEFEGAHSYSSASNICKVCNYNRVSELLEYTFSNGKAEITSAKKSLSGNVIIPETLGGYPVSVIDSYAFSSNTKIVSVVIPEGVTLIGNSAFEDCTGLKEITIPGSVTLIGSYAFCNCEALKNVYFTGQPLDWGQISVGGNNDPLHNAQLYFVNCKHEYSEKLIPATCTVDGSRQFVCVYCELSYSEVIKASGHSFSQWETTLEPTVKKEGREERVCSTCNEKETRAIAKLEYPTEITISTNEKVKTSTLAENSVFVFAGQRVRDLQKLTSELVTILDKNSKAVSSKAMLTTGMKLVLCDENGKTLDTLTVVVPGDVDCDGMVKASDARRALRCAVGLDTLSECEKTAADLVPDSGALRTINSADARYILRAVVGLESFAEWFNELK